MLSHIQLFLTPWTTAQQAPLSMEFSRQEYWSSSILGILLQGIFPTPWSNPRFWLLPHWQADSFPICHLGNQLCHQRSRSGANSMSLLKYPVLYVWPSVCLLCSLPVIPCKRFLLKAGHLFRSVPLESFRQTFCRTLLTILFVWILLITLHLNYQSTNQSPCQIVALDFVFPAPLHFNLGWIPSARVVILWKTLKSYFLNE